MRLSRLVLALGFLLLTNGRAHEISLPFGLQVGFTCLAPSKGAAFAHLEARACVSAFLAPGVQVHLISVEFAAHTRSIADFEYETLGDGN